MPFDGAIPDPRLFAALGDDTRLRLLDRLRAFPELSTSSLASGTDLTRQAVTKHLEVLAQVGLVRDTRRGRERVWRLDAAPLRGVAAWAEAYRDAWEGRFDRLEAYLRDEPA